MNLTEKEVEFLQDIDEADERGCTITFYTGEEERLKKYREKYEDVYKLLEYANVINGCLEFGSGLKLTPKGKEELKKALIQREKELEKRKDEKRKFKLDIITAIIIAFISATIGAIVTLLFK